MNQDPPLRAEGRGNGGAESVGPPDAPLQERLQSVCRPFSFREIADLTGSNHESVRRYLNGQNPGVLFVIRLCEVLHISADWLLLGRGTPMYLAESAKVNDESLTRTLDALGEHFKQLALELAKSGQIAHAAENAGSEIRSPAETNGPPPPLRVRLLLGPANGLSLDLAQPPPGQIALRVEPSGEVVVTGHDRPAEPGELLYKRVLDRSYRWSPSDR